MRRRRLVALVALLPFGAVQAQSIEIIELRFRTADQVLPMLEPLLEPGGGLSGQGNQIFLRATRASAAQIRQVLATLDRPPRQLLIRVRQDLVQSDAERTVNGDGTVVVSSRGTAADVRVAARDSSALAVRGTEQSVRVLEGGRAYITMGAAIPFTFRQWLPGPHGRWTVTQNTTYYEALTGFFVQPHVAGDVATLDIAPEETSIHAGAIERARLFTRVQARLGQWVAVGGAEQRQEGAGGYASASQRGAWLLVEEVVPR